MSLQFRKRIKLFPGVSLNLGKTGVRLSAGIRGARVTFGKDRTTTTIGIPGTGIYDRTTVSTRQAEQPRNLPEERDHSLLYGLLLVLALILVSVWIIGKPTSSSGGWVWLIIGGAIWTLWRVVRAVPNPAATPTGNSSTGSFAKIRGNGKYQVEVVGESFYALAFETLIREHRVDDLRDAWFCDAQLKLEDSNPYDENAVAVYVEGQHVGYLSREMAVDFRQSIIRDGIAQYRHQFTVGARVYWGGDDARHSVTLDIPQE